MGDWVKNQDQTHCCLQEIHLTGKKGTQTKEKGLKKMCQESSRNQSGVTMLISDKADFKQKLLRRHREGQNILRG
jgi:exonuclease III